MNKLLLAIFAATALYCYTSEDFQAKLDKMRYEWNYDKQVVTNFWWKVSR